MSGIAEKVRKVLARLATVLALFEWLVGGYRWVAEMDGDGWGKVRDVKYPLLICSSCRGACPHTNLETSTCTSYKGSQGFPRIPKGGILLFLPIAPAGVLYFSYRTLLSTTVTFSSNSIQKAKSQLEILEMLEILRTNEAGNISTDFNGSTPLLLSVLYFL